jgi:hypothetical protein
MKFALDAIRAKRALVTANPRVGRIRWKIPVAILAVRSKLERHDPITFAAEYVRFAGSNAPQAWRAAIIANPAADANDE